MSTTVAELARLVDGIVCGNGDARIEAARTIGEAGQGDICFIETEQRMDDLARSRAGAAVVPMSVESAAIPLIRVGDPLMAFIAIFRRLSAIPADEPPGIDPRAVVGPGATIGEDVRLEACAQVGAGTVVGARCRIGAGAVIGRHCRIGEDVTIHPNAVLYDRTIVGSRVIIHAGAVVGADGFGYRMRQGRHIKVAQLGRVEIGDDVEIGANATIDRSTFEVTRIGEGTKIDNLVQIAHNCQIGRHNILVSQSGIAGSSSTGDHVVIAGQAGIKDHVRIGSRAVIGAQAGVDKDVLAGERVLGTPAVAWRDFTFNLWAVGQLAQWRKDLKRIKGMLGITDNG